MSPQYLSSQLAHRTASISLSLLMVALLTACSGGSSSTYTPVTPTQKFAIKVGSTTGQATHAYSKGSTANDYSRDTSSLSFTQTSRTNANTLYSIATSGNSSWNDNLHRFDVSLDKPLTYEKNFAELTRTGIVQIFALRDVIPSTSTHTSALSFTGRDIYQNTPTNTQLTKSTIDGTGVNVAIIDGKSLNTHRDFAHTPIDIEFKAESNTSFLDTSGSTSTSANNLIENTGKHGTFVGLIIAGKRGTQGPGIAPGVQLATLALRNLDLNTGNYFKLVQQHKFTSTGTTTDGTNLGNQVHIISNSYSLGTMLRTDKEYLTKLQQAPTVHLMSDTDLGEGLELTTTFSSLYNVLNSWGSQPASARLLLFAAGNLEKPPINSDPLSQISRNDAPYIRFLKSYVDHNYYIKKPEERKNTQPNISQEARAQLLDSYFIGTASKISTSNFNSNEHVLTNLLQFPQIADHSIVVTGYSANDTGKNSEIVKRIKQYVLDGTIDGKNVLKEVEDNWNNIKPANETFDKVILNPNALACGEVQYSCLAASFTYNFPHDETAATSSTARNATALATSKSGTSFSTPQVSAVAALVKQQFDWMTAAQLKQTILTTALDVGQRGVDKVFGWGLLNGIGALNGPMLFNAGDFIAQLDRVTKVGKNYYFNNNIYGSGGLRVSGGSQDYLYLTGANSFTGDIIVNSANLVVVNRYVAGITQPECSNTINGRCYIRQPSIAANTYINSNGKLFAVNAHFTKNLTINGLASLAYTKVGNLKLLPNATLVIDMQASNNRIDVEGTAEIQGKIKFINSHYYTRSSTQDYTFLRAGNLNYKGTISVDDQGLIATDVYQDGQLLGIRASARTPTQAAPTLAAATGLGEFDSAVLKLGAHNLNELFVQADTLATRESRSVSTLSQEPSRLTNSLGTTTSQEKSTLVDVPAHKNNLALATSTNSLRTDSLALTANDDNLFHDDLGNDAQQFLSQFAPTAVYEAQQGQGITLSTTNAHEASLELSTSGTTNEVTVSSNDAVLLRTALNPTNKISAPQDLRQVAGQLQHLSTEQQAVIMTGMAGTSYASLQQLATSDLRQSLLDFSRAVQQARLGKQVYINAVSRNQHYRNHASQITADAQQYLMGAGVTNQWDKLNVGLAAHLGNLQLSEYFNGSTATRLNSGSGKTTSLTGALTYNMPRYYLTSSLALATHAFETARENLSLATNHGSLRTNQALLNLGAGYRLYQENAWQITLGAGLIGVLSQQQEFFETTVTPYWDTLNLHGNARTNLASYLNLEGTVSYALPLLNDIESHLEFQVHSTYALSGNDWGVDIRTTNASQFTASQRSAQIFGLDFTTQLRAGWNIQITPDVQLHLTGQYLHTSNFDEKTAQTQLLVKF